MNFQVSEIQIYVTSYTTNNQTMKDVIDQVSEILTNVKPEQAVREIHLYPDRIEVHWYYRAHKDEDLDKELINPSFRKRRALPCVKP